MMKALAGGMKRACALMLSVFMILSQFAIPVAALAQYVNALPQLTLYYTEGENTQSVPVWASLYGTEAVYWAQVPGSAFSGVTLEIAPSPDAAITYNSTAGYQLYAGDASAVDGNAATMIEVYRDGAWQGSYPLYLSSMPMPQPEPEPEPEPEVLPSFITVKYVDRMSFETLYTDGGANYYETTTFYPDASLLPDNYVLDSSDPVTMSVSGNGESSEVNFYATYQEPAPEVPEEPDVPDVPVVPEEPAFLPSFITVKYVDIATFETLYTDGGFDYYETTTFYPDASVLPENYVLTNTDAVTMYVTGDGTPSEVNFYATYQAPAPEVPEEPDVPDVPEVPEEPDFLPSFITVKYVDIATFETLYTDGGFDYYETTTFYPDASVLPENYVLTNTDAVTMYVTGDGTPSEVNFYATYQAPAPEVPEEPDEPDVPEVPEEPERQPSFITVKYVDIATFETLYTDGGANYYETTTFYPDASVLPENYVLNSTDPVTMSVSGNGESSEVNFYATYQAPEVPEEPEQPEQPTIPDGAILINGKGETTGKGLNMREGPGKDYKSIGKISVTGTVVDVILSVQNDKGELWYQVAHEGKTGYVSGDFLKLIDEQKPVTANVSVRYVDENGNPVADATVKTLDEGVHQTAAWKLDVSGYTYLGVNVETVTVGQSGADVMEVVFSYERNPVTVQVTFRYLDQQGNTIGLSDRVETLEEGTHDTAIYAVSEVSGYRYTGASAAQVVISAEGASTTEVIFTYERLPDAVTLPVYFFDADRNPLMAEQVITFTPADFGKSFQSSLYVPAAPEGYQFAGVSSETITIDAFGGLSPAVLEVTYTVKPKATARVTFEYLSEDGKKVADLLTVELSEGTHDVMEYAAKPEKYNFSSVSSQTVTITPDGKAQPEVITFTYAPVKDKATLKVHYRSAIGEDFPNSPEIRELPVGQHLITPNAAFAPQGNYALSAGTQQYNVTVTADLIAEPNSVTFTYYDASVTADVTVRYQDSVNGTLIAEEVRKLTPGTHDLQPDEVLLSTKGNYVKSNYNTNTRVVVSESGKPDYTTVIFYYEPAQSEDYRGYLLVTQQTSLRHQPSQNGQSTAVLPIDTVLVTNGQEMSGAIEWYSSVVQTGKDNGKLGWVDGNHVRRISSDEAAARMEEDRQPDEPEQNPGLYRTIMDGVPLRRYMSTAAEAKYLKVNVIVTVSGQEYDENGYLWHRTSYDGVNGYVRDGQLQKLTPEEVDDYLAGGGNTSTGTPDQYDPNGASSYGYITSDQVNFRSAPGGTRIKMLNKYAMALIVGTRNVNGVTWYNVNYSGQVGWVHGDYFHQMSLTEFTSFMGSNEYYQGITNNTAKPTVTTPSTSTGSATQGNVGSVEDWNVGTWQNPSLGTQATYQPFNPYATPAATAVPNGTYTTNGEVKFYQSANTNSGAVTIPKDAEIKITGTVTLSSTKWYAVTYEGKTGYVKAEDLGGVSATATPAPTSTFVIGTMIPIDYEDESKETQTSSVPWLAIGAAVVLVGGAGGVYAYALNQNKRRKAAARAAAARRAQAQQQPQNGSPYARRAVAAPTAPKQSVQQPQVRNPYASGSVMGQSNPYSAPKTTNPYATPVDVPPIVNPYATASTEVDASQPASTNPYARPIGKAAPAPSNEFDTSDPSENQDAQPRRRATRMQRYHATNDDQNNE